MHVKIKGAISVIAFLAIVFFNFPYSQHNSQVEAATDYQAATLTELTNAIVAAPSNGVSTGIATVIEITNDITLASAITIPSGKNILIQSTTGNTFQLNQATTNTRHFSVSGTLSFKDIVLDGGTTGGGVYAGVPTSVVNINAGTTIQNCATSNKRGAGLEIYTGTLNMSGGVIKKNKQTLTGVGSGGGGVYVDNNGKFIMTGGIIGGTTIADANTAFNCGGAVNLNNSTFTMSGDSIISNNSANSAGGIFVNGSSTFNMSGNASISQNKGAFGGGVNVNNSAGTFNMSSGTISKNVSTFRGGGVYTAGKFNMTGGVVGGASMADANTADVAGGGLYSDEGGTITLSNNALVTHNSATSGGGIYVYSSATVPVSKLIMNNASTVTFNQSVNSGGGVYVAGNDTGIMIMNDDSTVNNNTAGAGGGGVGVQAGTFTMNNNASISNNAAAENGGGLVLSNEGFFIMNDNCIINNNSAVESGGGVFLNQGNTMTFNSGMIRDNIAEEDGGGVYVVGISSLTPSHYIMTGGTITNNIAKGTTSTSGGGGIYYVPLFATLDISGASRIVNNDAPNGHGGGIYCTVPDWGEMNISSTTVFTGNHASVAYIPPASTATDYPTVQFASLSIPVGHSLNNYDINYFGGVPVTFGEMSIAKTVTGAGAPIGVDYIFTVTKGGVAATGDYCIDGGTVEPIPTNGEIVLQAGQQAMLTNLAAGTDYQVVESNPGADYTTSYQVDTGTVVNGDTAGSLTIAEDAATAIEFTNIFTTVTIPIDSGTLSISKAVTGTNAPAGDIFTFEVTIGTDVTKDYIYTVNSGPDKQIKSGGIITLTNGETAVFKDVLADETYTVVESEKANYSPTPTSRTITGAIAKNTISHADFINQYTEPVGNMVKTGYSGITEMQLWLLFGLTCLTILALRKKKQSSMNK